MPRMKNDTTGVVINVDDDTAAALSGYVPTDDQPAKAPAKRAPKAPEK